MLFALFALLALAAVPDTPSNLLDEGYGEMYNLQFDAAHRSFQEWERLYPTDPMGPVSDAAAHLFFEFDRLNILRSELFVDNQALLRSKRVSADSRIKAAFEADLADAKRLAQETVSRSGNEENALLATVLAIALHANYEALIEKQYWQSLKEIKEARNDADNLLSKYPDCYDANLAVGVENYLLSLKPAPVRWFLQLDGAETDRKVGIAKLGVVAEKGRYLRPYAKILLAIAALRSDNKPEARRLLTDLAQQFPNNDLFRDELKRLG